MVAANNWQPLGAASISVDSPTLGAIEFPAFDMLMVQWSINGYDVADAAGFIFNYDYSPAFGFYSDRHLYVPVGVTTMTNSQTLSTTTSRIAGFTTIQPQSGAAHIYARTSPHTFIIMNQTGSGSAAIAAPVEVSGGGNWEITDPITSIEIKTSGGNNMLSGSGFAAFGYNIV